MRIVSRYLTWIGCLISLSICHAQNFRVSDPRLELRDNIIHITYDILESEPTDKFIVDLVVTDAAGKRIRASALSGDVGEMVTGGNNKHIAWDLTVDKIEMNAQIYVKVHAKFIPPPEPAVTAIEKQEEVLDSPEVLNEDPDQGGTADKEYPSTFAGKDFSRTGLILQSIALPGLGLSRVTENPHWIRGVAGYGCLAGAVILNRSAISTYEGIIDLSGYDEKNKLYQKSQSQDQASEILAYLAIGIWVTDIVWTLVGTADYRKTVLKIGARGFNLYASVLPGTKAPVMRLVYRF